MPPALGLFVQPAWPCNHLWCIRRACSAHDLGEKPPFRESFALIQAEEEDREEGGEVCTCGMETSTGMGGKQKVGQIRMKLE